ncbi:hypothetical protein [Pseudomonas sp. NBRC 111130]|uniref:hypothetical protein n=1 Tax=Pseudomonas sp. NBRC 111130 TaxID=1661045 RepID=UPI000AD41BE5|nr:hypothetical protein [Pseudomonas sp. NBRC 111130]
MSDVSFFEFAFSHVLLMLGCMLLTSLLAYLAVRRRTVLGYMDPLHFYWTFTFGTAYGVVLALYVGGYVDSFYFAVVMAYAGVFLLSFRMGFYLRSGLHSVVGVFLVPRGKGRFEFYFVLLAYSLLALFLMWKTGFGVNAESNRFEQNRGVGAFVRVADGFRLFILSYLALMCFERWRAHKRGLITWGLVSFYLGLLVLSSLLNGAKFAILEGIYASLFALAVQGYRLRLGIGKVFAIFSVVLFFAIWVLSRNLEQAGVDDASTGVYMQETPILYERLALRVLANADKYYLSLPNGVIEDLKTDSALIQLLAPLVSITKMSELVGHPVNDYTVGRQALLYWYPDYDVAGGPTSHFDLFSYKYFGLAPGLLFAAFIGFFLSAIASLSRFDGGPFYAAICATLWLRSIPVLLEPATGLAYVLDIFTLFFIVKLFGALLRGSSLQSAKVGA